MLTFPTIDAASFREAMSHFAAAVNIVTTDGPAGRRGVTATSVVSVSDDPATLLVCLNTSSAANERFEANGCFAINLLSAANEKVARGFAGEGELTPEQRFDLGNWEKLETGSPVLAGSLAGFDCKLVDARIVATHRVMIGEVVGLRLGERGEGLLYRDRAYHRF